MTCKFVMYSTLKEKIEIQRGVFQEGESAETKTSSCPQDTVMWGHADLGRGSVGAKETPQVWTKRGGRGWRRTWSGGVFFCFLSERDTNVNADRSLQQKE